MELQQLLIAHSLTVLVYLTTTSLHAHHTFIAAALCLCHSFTRLFMIGVELFLGMLMPLNLHVRQADLFMARVSYEG